MKGKVVKGSGPSGDDRHTGAAGGEKKVIKREVHSATEESKRILEEAEARAKEVIAEAEAKADSIRDKARREGHEEGIEQLHELLVEFQEKQKRLYEESREELIQLAVKIAEKILGRELTENKKALGDIAVKAMRGISGEKKIQVRVNPKDLPQIKKDRERLLDEAGPGKEIELREDRTVPQGGCIVETDLGIIDARLDTQLKTLERALLSRAKKS